MSSAEYMRNYRKNNLEYYDKEKKYIINYNKERYNNDEEYREKRKAYMRNYMKDFYKQKVAFSKIEPLF